MKFLSFMSTLGKWTISGIVIILLIVGMINLFTIQTTKSRTLSINELSQSEYAEADIPVLVLGAGVIENIYPSQILAQRLNQAEEIYRNLPEKSFIMSGDHRESNYNEVGVMKNYLLEAGLPSEQIYLDHAGTSTFDSLYRLKHIIKSDQVVIVTQAYHLPRALMIAKGIGLEAVGVAAPESSTTRLYRESREVLARLKDFAVLYLGYQPENKPNLNYAFDLEKSGDLTNKKEELASIKSQPFNKH